jgi:hypothetical protein
MGYEVKLVYHPRKEDGAGYDMTVKKEEIVKVGRPFDDTSLERLAGVVMSQMARRDIFVVAEDMEITELVRNQIGFKESKDGKGIVLKNKKFSFNEAAQMVAEDIGVPDPRQQPQIVYQQPQQQIVHPHEAIQAPVALHNGQHPHEAMAANVHRQQSSIDDLYANPNRPVPIARQNSISKTPVNPKKILYKVYIDQNNAYGNEFRRLPAKLSLDKDYPVHAVIPSATGRLDMQRLAITDDSGKIVEVEEKYFTSVGNGLVEDHDGRFSGGNQRKGVRRPKLAFEDEMYLDGEDPRMAGRAIPHGIPVDDGHVPDELMRMPDIRPGRRAR